jgi:hypothetical protein
MFPQGLTIIPDRIWMHICTISSVSSIDKEFQYVPPAPPVRAARFDTPFCAEAEGKWPKKWSKSCPKK